MARIPPASSDASEAPGTALTNVGPVGEPGLPPSRPSAGTGDVPGTFASADRMAVPSSSGYGRGTTREAHSQTHAPSLISQGFLRPMSSQALQAQRSPRPDTAPTKQADASGGSGWAGTERRAMHSHRNSDASFKTLRDGRPPILDGDIPPVPSSRGTIASGNGSLPTELNFAGGVRAYDSQTPLRGRDPAAVPVVDSDLANTPRSPRSLRAPFSLGSRGGRSDADRRSNGPREKLDSHPPSPNGADEKRQGPAHRHVTGRNYEYFAGNSLFCFSGRLMNTKAWPLSAVTMTLTVLLPALFFAFSAPWLWHNISPAIPIIFAYIFYITLSSFLHAALTDSGILPRNLHPHPPNPEEERDALALGPPTTEWVMVKTFSADHRAPANDDSGESGPPEAMATAMEVPTKYCKTCNIWRPPRAHHCRICDACIETQDHHCVWINNCVGRRNYRCFFAYIGMATVLCLLLIAFELTHVASYARKHHISFASSLTGRTQERVAFALFIIALFALPYPGSLFVYHVFLCTRGETTREYLNTHKFPPRDRHRPFTQATEPRNLMSVLFRPRPPAYLRFDQRYEEGDVRLGHLVRRKERRRDLKTRYSTPARRGKRSGEVEMEKLPSNNIAAGGTGPLGGPVNSTPR